MREGPLKARTPELRTLRSARGNAKGVYLEHF